MGAFPYLLLALGFVAANLPFLSPRVLIVGPRKRGRALGWELVALMMMAAFVIAGGMAWESRIGQRSPQEWEFYAAFAGLFITLAFPGFVWRHLRRRRPGE
jgi:ligand-binding SRPBCC domain-containing protein